MRSVTSLSLIFLVLLGQFVAAVPHVHGESQGTEPIRHATRGHVHLHAGSDCHEDHDHEPEDTPSNPISDDHDSDAVYVGDFDLSDGGNAPSFAELALVLALIPDLQSRTPSAELESFRRLLFDHGESLRPKCALYSQILSIRC